MRYDSKCETGSGILDGLFWLIKLYLDGNTLVKIHLASFRGVDNLQVLFLSHNLLARLQSYPRIIADYIFFFYLIIDYTTFLLEYLIA